MTVLVGVLGFEPRKCLSQSQVPYRLAIPQYKVTTMLPHTDVVIGIASTTSAAWRYPNIELPNYISIY